MKHWTKRILFLLALIFVMWLMRLLLYVFFILRSGSAEISAKPKTYFSNSGILDFDDFKFIKSGPDCRNDDIYFMILVHSHPSHGPKRKIIRETWGSIKKIGGKSIQLAFLLGITSNEDDEDYALNENILLKRPVRESRSNVDWEGERYGDIIQGNFIDTYKNLTYKHLMGHKWLAEKCNPPAKTRKLSFLLKTDDDVFVEIFHLFKFVNAIYGSNPSRSLVCDVIPQGTSPRKNGKWAVQKHEFQGDAYPEYCSGMAYLMTPDLAPEFLAASSTVPKFWIDDVYVMGLLREKLGIHPFYLNLRYTYDEKGYRKWLHSKRPLPLPFLFVHIDTHKKDWMNTVKQLWFKTVNVHAAIST